MGGVRGGGVKEVLTPSKILRFWNNDVLENLDGVFERIKEYFPPSLTLPTLRGGGNLKYRKGLKTQKISKFKLKTFDKTHAHRRRKTCLLLFK